MNNSDVIKRIRETHDEEIEIRAKLVETERLIELKKAEIEMLKKQEEAARKLANEIVDNMHIKSLPPVNEEIYLKDAINAKRKEIEEQAEKENWKIRDFTDSDIEYMIYRDDINNHFNNRYDFNSLAGIEQIPIVNYTYPSNQFGGESVGLGSPIGNIEYILNARAGGHYNNGRLDLAIACLYKANNIIFCSEYQLYDFRKTDF